MLGTMKILERPAGASFTSSVEQKWPSMSSSPAATSAARKWLSTVRTVKWSLSTCHAVSQVEWSSKSSVVRAMSEAVLRRARSSVGRESNGGFETDATFGESWASAAAHRVRQAAGFQSLGIDLDLAG